MLAPGKRQRDAPECPPRVKPERARDLLQPRVDRGKADPRRVHRVRRGDEQHRHHDAGERAPEFEPDQRPERFAQHALTAEHHEQRDAGNRMRHRERQIDQSLDHAFAGKAGARQAISQRHPGQCRERRRQKRAFKAEHDGVAHIGHARHFGETRPGLRQRQRNKRNNQKRRQQAAEKPAQQIKPARATRRGALAPRAARRTARCYEPGHGSTSLRKSAGIASACTA